MITPFPFWSTQVSLGPTDSYTTSNLFAHGSFIAPMMEAVRNFETLVYSNETTWHYIPEGSNLHTCRCENLKSHQVNKFEVTPEKLKKT
jgi:hypothetical protein